VEVKGNISEGQVVVVPRWKPVQKL
jgi:hypothetical protein